MRNQPFSAQVRLAADIAIIDMQGEIDAFAEEGLNAAYEQAESHDPAAVLLNFADVDYINSTGIALIVSLLARARKAHRQLLTCGLSDHYIEIFNITRLVDFMDIFPNEAAALAAMQQAQ